MESSAATINVTLAEAYEQLDANPAWKSKVDYVVSRKGQATRIAKIFDYQGPDIDTFVLLIQYREMWKTEPVTFVSFGMGQVTTSNHPVLQAALNCLSSEQHDAWSTMLRRCQCMVLSALQKLYRMTPENVAVGLEELVDVPYRGKELLEKVKSLLDAGSKYDWLEQQLGRGVTFVLGKMIKDQTWEKHLHKFGKDDSSRAALKHLASTGISELAAQHRDMRNAIIFFMLTGLLEPAMTPAERWKVAQGIVYGTVDVIAHHQMWTQSLGLYADNGCFNTVPQPFVSTW